MGIFSDFKKLWHRKRESSFAPTPHEPLPTTRLVSPPASTSSARKEKASMVHTLRQRYRQYRSSSTPVGDDTTEISTSSSCPPSQLALDFHDDHMENGSLVEFFQNYNMADGAPC